MSGAFRGLFTPRSARSKSLPDPPRVTFANISETPANVAAKLRRARTFYVIQMHGHFRLPTGSTNEPKFPYIHVFVSLQNARIAALFLHAHRSLSVLGTVARL